MVHSARAGTLGSRTLNGRSPAAGTERDAAPRQSQTTEAHKAEFVVCKSTIYGWFRRWLERGLLDAVLRAVARLRRRAAGRRRAPRLGIIDTQAVRCIGVRGARGYDAGKKVWGRKRVALVDAAGHWLAVAVVPASVQDRDTLPALDAGKARWPSLREAIYDGAFAADRCRAWSNLHGMRHRIAARDPAAEGFVVVARRRVVERSFGWLAH